MTDAQRAAVPGILREILDLDREIAQLRDHLAGSQVVHFTWGHTVRRARALRDELTAGARHLYGRGPLRGDTGPGRPIAMAA